MKNCLYNSFAADVMLGSLAKWLRILGYDTFYSNKARDNQLLEIIWRENRVLLSRDTRLVASVHPQQRLYIKSKSLPQQLQQVVRHFDPAENIVLFSRCSLCNAQVEKIDKKNVCNHVPEFVFHKYNEFYVCPVCRHIFWPGTHRDLAVQWLAKHNIVRLK